MIGLTLSSTKARTVSRTNRSSSPRSASTSKRSTPGKRLTEPPAIGCCESLAGARPTARRHRRRSVLDGDDSRDCAIIPRGIRRGGGVRGVEARGAGVRRGISSGAMGFPGGSAYAMSRDIAEGYTLVTERTFRTLTPGDLDKLVFEMDRHLRELRGDQPALEDIPAIQQRNRRIQRLNQAMLVLRSFRSRQKP